MRRRRAIALVLLAGGLALTMPGTAVAAPVIPGTETIALVTKKDGVGPHPVLRWKSVPDAAHYLLVVQTPKGDPYWSWQGAATRVRFGGGPLDAPERSEGASLTRKMVWLVMAFDDGGAVIASSAKRAISP
jgi:hypothetical protein